MGFDSRLLNGLSAGKFRDRCGIISDHIADLQNMAVAEWLQSFNSVRGPMERLGTM